MIKEERRRKRKKTPILHWQQTTTYCIASTGCKTNGKLQKQKENIWKHVLLYNTHIRTHASTRQSLDMDYAKRKRAKRVNRQKYKIMDNWRITYMETKVFPSFSFNFQLVWLCGLRNAACTMHHAYRHTSSNVRPQFRKCISLAFTLFAEISWGRQATTVCTIIIMGKC